ncbi:DUF3368 domain-containing protein [Imperialibacter sp. 75]|uniref:DUF3368 domain-containing protein n=2 Tax=Imperialibacter TaxID=1649461 RepID=UPI00191B440A|nr:DUF3368 domain-containing protein [Imperialibacter sp. 75]
MSNLIVIQKLDLLRSLFGDVFIPERVFVEIEQLANFGIDMSAFVNADWIKTKSLEDLSVYDRLTETLDRGESEAIALSLTYTNSLLLIDERKGRAIAESYNIRCIGLVGILILAKEKGFIGAVKPLLDQLIEEANFFISAKVYQSALSAANEVIK